MVQAKKITPGIAYKASLRKSPDVAKVTGCGETQPPGRGLYLLVCQ
ncbi:MAG: hypothetical protein R6U46_08815 [Marinilabilia sp.]